MPDDQQTSANQLYRVINGQSTQPFYQLSPVAADQRVQPAGNVQLLGTQQANGATSVAIGFTKPPDPNIDHFEIWVQRSAYSSENPYQVASVTDAPATFTVAADQNTVVIAFIRTIQKNGLATDLQASPTVTFNVTLASGLVPAANITAGTLISSVIYSGTINCSQLNAGTIPSGIGLPASQVNAGTLSAGVVYAGTINCSQLNAGTITAAIGITAGTFTGSTLQLNLNGVTTTINNAATISGQAGLKVQNNTSSLSSVVSDQGHYLLDSGGVNRGSLAWNGNGGTLTLSDSSGRAFNVSLSASPSRVLIDGTQVLSTRVATTPVTLADVIAVLQHHGLSN
jgi:hypothetical protein